MSSAINCKKDEEVFTALFWYILSFNDDFQEKIQVRKLKSRDKKKKRNNSKLRAPNKVLLLWLGISIE